MDYEIRVWKEAKKMPKLEPKAAKGRLEAMKSAIQDIAMLKGNNLNANPDIMIEKDAAGDGAIKYVKIKFELKDINVSPSADVKIIHTIRTVRIQIKGNLYLPIHGSLTESAKSMLGDAKDENKKKNTLRLSEWAQLQPDAKEKDGYYRGVTVSILTKAGDFRIIQANNVYVESYEEDYSEGEFGTFEIFLNQRADATSEVTVKGLNEEEQSVMDQIKGAVDKAADKAGKAAAVIGTVGVVGKVASTIGNQVISTVETFTGETAASRRAKQAMGIIGNASDVTSSTGKIVETAAHEKDKNKKAQAITQEIGNMTGKVNDSVKDGYNADTDVQKLDVTAEKVKKLEETYKKDFTKEELDVYNRMDNKGKLEMLQKKKEVAEKKIEVERNKAIIEAETKKQEAAAALDKKFKETVIKSIDSGDKK